MPLRFALALTLLGALLALPAGAHAADTVRPSSVSETASVPARGTATLTVNCPAGAVALNAAVTRQGRGVAMRRSVPGSSGNTWSFRFSNASRGSRSVAAVLRCVRLAVPDGITGARLAVRSRSRSGMQIPAGETADVRLGCGRGWLATGYGFAPGAAAGRVRVAAAVPLPRAWDFTLENTGAGTVTARVHIRCLRAGVPASRGGATTTLRFRVARPSFDDTVGAGSDGFSHACARRQFAVANGLSLDPGDDIVMTRSFPALGRRGVWSFRQAGADQPVETSLVCLGRASRFR